MALNGIDVSHYQNGINLAKISADFVIMKATEATSFVDPCCDSHYQEAKGAGKLLGVYHFARGTGTGKEEADYFLKHCENYVGESILVLDFEYTAKPNANTVKWSKTWLDRVYEKTGVRPLIYMSHSCTRYTNWSSVAKNYGLWVARYANNQVVNGYQKDPWLGNEGTGAFSTVAIHQYTSTGRLSGWSGNLDLDIAYMSKDAWKKYACPNSTSSSGGGQVSKEVTIKQGETLVVKGA